jgi:hypothetical protein
MWDWIVLSISIIVAYLSCKYRYRLDPQEVFWKTLFSNYQPIQTYTNLEELNERYIRISNRFMDQEASCITHKMFKNIEFITAEKLIALANNINISNDSFIIVQDREKMYKILTRYLLIFESDDKDGAIKSLKYRIYMNCTKLQGNVYGIMSIINLFLWNNFKSNIDEELLQTFKKNDFWYHHLFYDYKVLDLYNKFIVNI